MDTITQASQSFNANAMMRITQTMTTDANTLTLWIADVLCNKPTPPFPTNLSLSIGAIQQIIRNQGIASLLYYHLKRSNSLSQIPSQLQDRLETEEKQSIAKELYRKKLNEVVFRRLKDRGIRFLLLKGEALAHSLYPESYLRTRSDADLLFENEADALLACNILQSEGYLKANTLSGKFVGYQFNCSKKIGSQFSHDIDVHHKISDYIWLSRKLPFDELFPASVEIRIDNIPLNTTGTVHSLIHNCIHRATNRTIGQENRLIWLYDIHLLSKKMGEEEWSVLTDLTKQKSLAYIVYDALKKVNELFETPVPQKVVNDLQRAKEKENSPFGRTEKRWRLYLFDFRCNKGLKNKLTQLGEHLFPSTEYMKVKYDDSKTWNLPYYYIKRLISGLRKYM